MVCVCACTCVCVPASLSVLICGCSWKDQQVYIHILHPSTLEALLCLTEIISIHVLMFLLFVHYLQITADFCVFLKTSKTIIFWLLILIFNWTGSKNHLWDKPLIMPVRKSLDEMGRPTLTGHHRSMDWGPGPDKKREQSPRIHLSWLPDRALSVTGCLTCLPPWLFPATVNCNPSTVWDIIHPPFGRFGQVCYYGNKKSDQLRPQDAYLSPFCWLEFSWLCNSQLVASLFKSWQEHLTRDLPFKHKPVFHVLVQRILVCVWDCDVGVCSVHACVGNEHGVRLVDDKP